MSDMTPEDIYSLEFVDIWLHEATLYRGQLWTGGSVTCWYTVLAGETCCRRIETIHQEMFRREEEWRDEIHTKL